jgi:hypothetical protein
MPDDPLQQVLQLVADGRLTAEEAEPILHALETGRRFDDGPSLPPEPPSPPSEPGVPRFARIEVTEDGRRAVNLRIPLSLGRRALSAIPGLSSSHAADIEAAVSRGLHGPILDIADEDGDGVRIVLE